MSSQTSPAHLASTTTEITTAYASLLSLLAPTYAALQNISESYTEQFLELAISHDKTHLLGAYGNQTSWVTQVRPSSPLPRPTWLTSFAVQPLPRQAPRHQHLPLLTLQNARHLLPNPIPSVLPPSSPTLLTTPQNLSAYPSTRASPRAPKPTGSSGPQAPRPLEPSSTSSSTL